MKIYFVTLCLLSVSCAEMRSSISDPYSPIVHYGTLNDPYNSSPYQNYAQTQTTPSQTATQKSPYGMAPGFQSLPTQTRPPTQTQPPLQNQQTPQIQQPTQPQQPVNNPGYIGTISDFKLSCEEARFVDLLNLYRQRNNLGRVSVSKAGVVSARWHTQDMINKNYFAHSEPDGRAFNSRAASFGYSAWAENIAAGSYSAEGVFCQWKKSSGHNTNMLGAHHQTIGIGMTSGGGTYGIYWENSFGPNTSDTISSPLTADGGCQMPTQLPGC